MAKKTVTLPSLSRVVAGAVALLEIPIGPTYEKIGFDVTGTGLTIAHIGKIAVIVNGNEVQVRKDLQRLIDENAYYNQSVDTQNEFMLHFDRDEFYDLADKLTPAFGTADLATFSIEITLAAGAPGNITMEAWAEIETDAQPLGVFTRIRETSLTSSAVGEVDFDRLQKGKKVYQAIHFFKSDINKIVLEADNFKIVDAKKSRLERLQKQTRPVARVPQTAKATHLDFNKKGSVKDLLNLEGVQDVRFKLTFGSVGTVEIVTEELSTEY